MAVIFLVRTYFLRFWWTAERLLVSDCHLSKSWFSRSERVNLADVRRSVLSFPFNIRFRCCFLSRRVSCVLRWLPPMCSNSLSQVAASTYFLNIYFVKVIVVVIYLLIIFFIHSFETKLYFLPIFLKRFKIF